MEFNNGLIAGLNREDAARRYPQVPDLPPHALYQQESMLDFPLQGGACPVQNHFRK